MTLRRLRLLIVFLLLGAIVNVAVAWGCAWRGVCWHEADMLLCSLEVLVATTARHGETDHLRNDNGEIVGIVHRNLAPRDSANSSFVTTGFKFFHTVSPVEKRIVVATGMPLQSLQGSWLPMEFYVASLPYGMDELLFPGFAINTIFHAAILWLLFFAPGAVLRTIRRKRGLCQACAYPVGRSPVCTECGKPVSPRASES
jgi:hypothetical protein